MPKLSAILFLSEFDAVVYVRLFFLYYRLGELGIFFGSLVTHEPILFKTLLFLFNFIKVVKNIKTLLETSPKIKLKNKTL